MRNVYDFQQSSSAGLNAACVVAHKSTGDPEKCIFAQWTTKHIKTPTWPLQSEYDAWQTGNVMGGGNATTQVMLWEASCALGVVVTCMGSNMSNSLVDRRARGAFLIAHLLALV